jgi:hypothetical protein
MRSPVLLSQARRGGGNGGGPLDLLSGDLDLEPPVAGGLFCRRRTRWLAPFFHFADHGGREWRRSPLLFSFGAALFLLFTSLPAGRGGEGLEVRSADVVAGGNPRSFPSNGGGVVEMSGKVEPAWCRCLPDSDFEAPPPNKLLAGSFLDLGLESPATPSPSSPRVLLCVASVFLACRGGEGKSDDNMPRPWRCPWARDVKGIPSPGVVTSPARGPVLPAARDRKGFASYPGVMFEHSPMSRLLLHAAILCLPPPVHGRFWEYDGGMSLLGWRR